MSDIMAQSFAALLAQTRFLQTQVQPVTNEINVHVRRIDGKPDDLLYMCADLGTLARTSETLQTVYLIVCNNGDPLKVARYIFERLHQVIRHPIDIQVLVETPPSFDSNGNPKMKRYEHGIPNVVGDTFQFVCEETFSKAKALSMGLSAPSFRFIPTELFKNIKRAKTVQKIRMPVGICGYNDTEGYMHLPIELRLGVLCASAQLCNEKGIDYWGVNNQISYVEFVASEEKQENPQIKMQTYYNIDGEKLQYDITGKQAKKTRGGFMKAGSRLEQIIRASPLGDCLEIAEKDEALFSVAQVPKQFADLLRKNDFEFKDKDALAYKLFALPSGLQNGDQASQELFKQVAHDVNLLKHLAEKPVMLDRAIEGIGSKAVQGMKAYEITDFLNWIVFTFFPDNFMRAKYVITNDPQFGELITVIPLEVGEKMSYEIYAAFEVPFDKVLEIATDYAERYFTPPVKHIERHLAEVADVQSMAD
jgi:hypothetical protein